MVPPPNKISKLKDTMEKKEKEYLTFVIKECNYNISYAAELLGIHRTGLYQKIRKYKISLER
ncbi:MAG: helix-turn-helix domain-containing protein [Anaerovoracaceae bacterium]